MKRDLMHLFLATLSLFTSYKCIAQEGINIVTQRTAPVGVISYATIVTSADFSSDRHVDGYIRKYGSASFIFPVGDKTLRRSFAAAADRTEGAYYFMDPNLANSSNTVAGGPFNTSLKDPDIGNISNVEFWDINGTNSSKITLTWDQRSDLNSLSSTNPLSKIFIAGWKDSKWVKIPSIVDATSILGGTSSITSGSISTTAAITPNQYQIYTIAAEVENALPVVLVNFEGRIMEDQVHLTWTTASEVNVSHFQIQRSYNGKNWTVIDIIKAQTADLQNSVSEILRNYSFIDSEPFYGENYYRLKMIDHDETYAYSTITSFNISNEPEIVAYPNPVTHFLYITGLDLADTRTVCVYDINGNKVLTANKMKKGEIDVRHLATGIYSLEMIDKKGYKIVKKIVISK